MSMDYSLYTSIRTVSITHRSYMSLSSYFLNSVQPVSFSLCRRLPTEHVSGQMQFRVELTSTGPDGKLPLLQLHKRDTVLLGSMQTVLSVCLLSALSSLIWSWLIHLGWCGWTPMVHCQIKAHKFSQPSPHTLRYTHVYRYNLFCQTFSLHVDNLQ